MFAPLRERNYRWWAAADLVSVTGNWMQVLALNWLVLTATGSATAMGAVLMLQALPVLLLGSWGGVLADRIPSRPMLIACQAIRGLLALSLVMASHHWLVYAVALASGVIGSFESPVLGRFGSALVPRESLGSALAFGSILNSAGRIGGMALGGILVGVAGPSPLFAINAVSYLGVIAALLAIRTGDMQQLAAPASRSEGGAMAGFRYLARQPVILIVLALFFVLSSLGRNYQISMAAMISGPLHGTAASYGLISTVFAIGAVTGGLLLAGTGRSTLRVLAATAFTISVLQFCAGLAPTILGFAALILPIAAGAVIFDTVVGTRILLDTREDMRGRVLASTNIVTALAAIVGAPSIGWLCDTLGARGALMLGGAITTTAVLVGVTALARAKSRSLTLPSLLGRPAQQPA
ncbi:MFS transporter [Actinoplanes sp. NPDC051851]|uniref:MFS transporter n=1 Tax=Actinoplanes sp. NPDC051851 TaxID=3154753 RepID=UPI00343F9354